MKLSNKQVFALALILSMGLKVTTAKADSIPGYIGSQSFRLTDDRDMANLIYARDNSRDEFKRAEDARASLQDQAQRLERRSVEIKNETERLNAEITSLKQDKTLAEEKLATLNQNPEANQAEIDKTKASIDRLDLLINRDTQSLSQLKLELGNVNPQLDRVSRDLEMASRRAADAARKYENINNQTMAFERQLVSDIQRINREGANRGGYDGNTDGAQLATSLGNREGSNDGSSDGNSSGTRDGINRDYNRGLEVGENEGAARAAMDGQNDGTILGTKDGNLSAGNREGNLAGIKRADKSDAAIVGSNQGKKAGMDRAISTGRINGEATAEKETTNKFESGNLNQVELKGAFAGSFEKRSPRYPGDFNGSNFHPETFANREILKKAYADGYIYSYRDLTERSYLNSIDANYNRAYEYSFRDAYQSALNKTYTEYFEKGRGLADARAYERDYPIVKNKFYQVYFNQFDQNPNKSSSDYISAYSGSEKNGYLKQYENIRSVNFDREELATFNANIESQTTEAKARRVTEVTKVYNENAILQYVSSEMFDGGILQVAKLDGIFQPQETTLHNVVIKNFGFKDAKNVRVKIGLGAEVMLPSIPARSMVKIIGAGTSQIPNVAIGANAKISLKVLAATTSDDAIEAIHFDNRKASELKSSDVKSTQVTYPIIFGSIGMSSQLLKDKRSQLNVKLANVSKRNYIGDMQIVLNANSQNPIIAKEFSKINSLNLGSSVELSDAEILVTSDSDIYRPLSISASIMLNGVKVGELLENLSVMAKAQYYDKGKLPVVIVDSSKSLNDLLDVIADLGGTEKVSVLDLTLTDLNSAVLNAGLNAKLAVVVDDEKSSVTTALNTLFSKSKNSSFVLSNINGDSLAVARTLSSFKDNQILNLDKRTILFNNPYRASVAGMSVFVATRPEGLVDTLSIAELFATTSQEMIGRIKKEINRTSFFTPSNLIKAYSLRTLAEILNINIAYDKSGHVFSRDKKWVEMIKNDSTLFINQLKVETKGGVTEEKLSTILSAIAMKDFVKAAINDFHDISKNMMSKISNATGDVLSMMEDNYKKSLKDFNKDLYNKVYEKVSIQRPFYIEQNQE